MLGIGGYDEKTQVYADLSEIKKNEIPKNKISRALFNLSGSSYEKLSRGDKKSLTDFYKTKNSHNPNPTDEVLKNFATIELGKRKEEVSKFPKDRAEHQRKVYSAVGEVLYEIEKSSPQSSRSPSPSPKPNYCETLKSKLIEKGALDENQGR